MAQTWRAVSGSVAYAASKSMIDIFQGGSGTRVYRARRMYHFTTSGSAVTGILTGMQIARTVTSSSGSAVSHLISHDTANTALDGDFSATTNATVTETDVFRRYFHSTDEASVSAATVEEWQIYVPFAEVWNAGYGEHAVQPITCRASQGVHIKCGAGATVGSDNLEIEFTNEAS